MITQKELKRQLHYDPETGVFTWLVASNPRVKIGGKAGCSETRGYLRVGINGRSYKLHRLAWLYSYGEFPLMQIDHINGIKDDNRLINLRDVSGLTNIQNQRTSNKKNSLGVLGVHVYGERYRASISMNSKKIYLGSFDTPDEAHAAYLTAKRLLHEGCTL